MGLSAAPARLAAAGDAEARDGSSRPLFVLNRTAGGGRGHRAEALVRAALREHGGRGELVCTERPWHAAELAEQGARAGYGPVVGVGGDGTLAEIANGLLRVADAPPLAAVPVGTGNDYARCLGLPGDPAAAVRLVWRGVPARMDVGLCGERAFLNAGGVGFDARVGRRASAMPRALRRGALPYVAAVLVELGRNDKYDLTLGLDGRRVRLESSLLVAVANGRYYGGGMKVCPDASREDGLLDVCVVGDLSRAGVLGLLPRVFWGGHVGHPEVAFHRAREVTIEGPAECGVQVDGEALGGVPATFRVLPGALRAMRPR